MCDWDASLHYLHWTTLWSVPNLLPGLQVGRLIDATSSFELEASEYQRKGVSVSS